MAIDVPIDPAFVAASGSVGDVTYGHNQWGPWTRPRATPTDPATSLQVTVRTHLSTLATAWNTTLTPAQRDAWNAYATAVTLPGRLGRRNAISGLPAYVRTNVPRLQATDVTLSRIDDAPTRFDLGPFSLPPTIYLNVIDDTFHPVFDADDEWVTDSGAAMLFWASTPQVLTRHFWKGPYQYAGGIPGRRFPPTYSPGTIALPQPAAVTDRVFIRGRLTQADGRLSTAFALPADVADQVAPLPIDATFNWGQPRSVDVTFDTWIRIESHDTANWFVRFAGYVWTVVVINTRDDYLRLVLSRGSTMTGPPIVTYSPPPDDVNGLVTGIPVAAFAGFPIT